MFQVESRIVSRKIQLAIAGLAALSLIAIWLTAWILLDIRREQETLARIATHLNSDDAPDALTLADELRLQARLTVLLILNIVATASALVMFVRSNLATRRALRNVRVVASDVLASMDQGVLTTDNDGQASSVNPMGAQLLGVEGADVVSISVSHLDEAHKAVGDVCREVLKSGASVRDRDYEIERHGATRTLRTGCSPLSDENGKKMGTVIHVKDVTEQSLVEQRLRRMERYTGLGSVVAGLHHEIKNPLSALSIHVQLIDEALRNQETSGEVCEMLDVLRTEVGRITDVLERFRDFASIAELQIDDADLGDLAARIVRLLEPQAAKQGVRIELCRPSDAIGTMRVDATRIEQVLLNLAINALDAMPGGGRLTIGIKQSSTAVEMRVSDTGPGVAADLRDKIFDAYFTTRGNGTGMGLAISEKIVRQHHGTLDLRSNSNGTTFVITLPVNGLLLDGP